MTITVRMAAYLRRQRHVWLAYAQVAIDLSVLTCSFFIAFWLRFDGHIPKHWLQIAFLSFPYVLVLTFGALLLVGARRFVWRYTGVREGFRLLQATTLVAAVLVAVRFWAPNALEQFKLPLGVITINYLLSYFTLVGARLSRRLQYEHARARGLALSLPIERVLLVGAGDAGRLVAKEIRRRPDLGLVVDGYVDDDDYKHGKWIEGVQVLGPVEDLEGLVVGRKINVVIITFSNVASRKIREIVDVCTAIPIPVRIVPGVYELVGERVSVSRLRDVKIEDLLARDVVVFDPHTRELLDAYKGQRILVTGAGGSIGSELCRQLGVLEPSSIIALDKDENAVFEVELSMRERYPKQRVHAVIADLRREDDMRRLFMRYRPQVIVHAAAHKHVPLLESQVVEAVDNNVLGTDLLVRLALEHAAARFVMVSTDKAVNPTNVMGATKRVAEMIVQVAAQQGTTRFSCVRFGNVLESRGSVVPIFKRQIARGGPVTVTHPDVTRYFMTIGEAAQLIIQAGSLGNRGEIFVLDMGEPVKVIDLARDLIRLSVPGREAEIAIEIIGMRPGEKLREELLIAEEGTKATMFRKILIAPQQELTPAFVTHAVQRLRRAVEASDEHTLRSTIAGIGIGYNSPDVRAAAPLVQVR